MIRPRRGSSTSRRRRSTASTPTTSASSRRSTRSSRRNPKAPSIPNEPVSWPPSASSAVDRSNPTPGGAASSIRQPGSGPESPARCCTSRVTPTCYIFEGGSWKTAFVGGSYEFLANGARMLDYRALMHYVGTGITPAMTHAAPGIGSQYAYTVDDANGATLDGAKRLHAHPARADPGQDVLGHRHLRHPDPLAAADRQPLPEHQRPLRRPAHRGQRRRRHPLRTRPARRHRRQLAANHSRQELVPDPPPLRTARSLVRPDLATRRDPTRIAAAAPVLPMSEGSGGRRRRSRRP